VHHGEGANLTVAMSYVRRIYNGGVPEVDVSSARNSRLLLASADVKGFHYDANAMFNDVIESGTHRAQFGQSLTMSHPVNKKVGISREIWHFSQPFLRSNAIGNPWGGQLGTLTRPARC
jgi:hypothetical protein